MEEKRFLNNVTSHLIQERDDFSKSLIIVPTRRAVFMLKEAIQEGMKKTGWLPRIMAIEDFIEELTGYRTLKGEELIPETYPIYKKVFTKRNSDFSNYLNFVHVLLSDLNDIDSYLLDVKQLFAYLRDERALKLWNPSGEKLSEFQQDYLDFWEYLDPFYRELSAKFDELKGGYRGYIYKQATVDTLSKFNTGFGEIETLDWVGFNNFNACEYEIFKQLVSGPKAELHISVDDFYYNDSQHEAGKFAREMVKKLERYVRVYRSQGFSRPQKTIRVHGVPGEYAVAKLAGSLLEGSDQNKKTALILADENLVLPVLGSLPPDVNEVNVTMGLPINKSRYYGFLQQLFKIRVQTHRDFRKRLHVPSLIEWLKHPGSVVLNINDLDNVASHLTQAQKAYISVDEFSSGTSNNLLFKFLNSRENTHRSQLDVLISLRNILLKYAENEEVRKNDATDYFMLQGVTDVLDHAVHFMEKYGIVQNPEELEKFWRLIAPGLSIPIKGNKSDFLQVMGVLESRVLDFDRIVVTSVNEGVFPAGRSGSSLIPTQIKAKFGLPDYSAGDAIFAYHFYRLLQFPAQIDLIYDSSAGDLSQSEPSRFIRQLKQDWGFDRGGDFEWTEHNFNGPKADNAMPVIEKTPGIIKQVQSWLSNPSGGLSASALNTYLNSPLDFYLKYVLRVKEPDKPEEQIEDSTFGTVVHDVLEELFTDFAQNKILIESQTIESLLPKVEEVLKRKFNMHFKGGFSTGSNFLMHKVALEMIRRFLDQQAAEAGSKEQFFIQSLEESEKQRLNVSGITCYLTGKADRIDKFSKYTRVVDYKTGKVEPPDLKLNDIDSLFDTQIAADKSKARQVLFYAWMVSKRIDNQEFKSGIYSMKNLSAGFIPLKIANEEIISQEILLAFESKVERVLKEILNPDVPFHQPITAKYTLFE